ncbi:MAG: hypothetical protein SGPRY_007489 [Prymnesium sp.]
MWYVHKFGVTSRFPPVQLVERCLQQGGELTVRAAAMLLKYVKIFKLEVQLLFHSSFSRVLLTILPIVLAGQLSDGARRGTSDLLWHHRARH